MKTINYKRQKAGWKSVPLLVIIVFTTTTLCASELATSGTKDTTTELEMIVEPWMLQPATWAGNSEATYLVEAVEPEMQVEN